MTLPSRQPSLFPAGELEFVSGVVDAAPVPVENGSCATFSRDATNRRWVRKRCGMTGVESLLAESLSHLLGRRLGVRQPCAALFREPGTHELSWLSEQVLHLSGHWRPQNRHAIANLDEVARMILLDVLTHNEDRHTRNILVQADKIHPSVHLWAIDSGDALIGYPREFYDQRRACPAVRNHAKGLPIDALRPHVMAAAAGVRISPAVLRALVEECCEHAGEPHDSTKLLVNALRVRIICAPALCLKYLELLGGLE